MAGVMTMVSATDRPPEGTPPAVEARALTKLYASDAGSVVAVDSVDLVVGAGRFVSVMGPSGSGKSTLLHLLGGLDTPTTGDVLVGGRSLGALSEAERTVVRRRHIGFVFQAFNLVPMLSVADNVAMPLLLDGRRDEQAAGRVRDVLGLVGLAGKAAEYPRALSGGEQQRVAIARALVADPEVILADEPTGNLDTKTGADVIGVLRTAQRDLGRTVIMVTHDARMASAGEEIVDLRDGRIVSRFDVGARRRRRPREETISWLSSDE